MPDNTFVLAQGGGPTAVINQTLVGAIEAIEKHYPNSRILGARHGVNGLKDGRFLDLSRMPKKLLSRIASTPGAALGSTRDKPDERDCETILNQLREVSAGAFIYIGGNDTAGTQKIISDASGGEIVCVHAPKTIDNDLAESDHTPGFITAAEFVAGAFAGVDMDFRSIPGIYVGIVMGRHAGFLTAAAQAWQFDENSGPHFICVPESTFDQTRFVESVRDVLRRHGRCVIAVSEGIAVEDGRSLVETLLPTDQIEKDPHGNIKLAGTSLAQAFEHLLAKQFAGVRTRVDTLGYLPRSHAGIRNAVDEREARMAGSYAVDAVANGSASIALQYNGRETFPVAVPLEAVAGKTRHLPDEYLEGANQLSAEGKRYFERLLPAKPKLGVFP